ncbi:MAG TPA: thioredoxin domain-containing protein [Acidobacteriaceae bacterium]|nr:thioredoxin domain-containing protein [Acidobacteriaceae bacterium]
MRLRTPMKQFLVAALVVASAISPSLLVAQQDSSKVPATPLKLPAPPASNFNAASPSRATVSAFLKMLWGYDANRMWEIWAIQKTQAPGVTRVVVEILQKNDPQHHLAMAAFLVTPDGKHLIAPNLSMEPFGEHPYTAARQVLLARADGPTRGAASKKLELVEFADLQCPHCRITEPVIERLLKDFPQAHFVFENFPLIGVHTEAFKAASYGICVAKEDGNAAFFKFIDDVFAHQDQLTPDTSDLVLGNATTKVGLDAAKVGACSYAPATKAAVNASIQLGKDLNVDETPTLFVNGRPIPVGQVASGQIPYDTLKQIINYQIKLDSDGK